MMDKNKIIEEGILEQYILGELHPKDEAYIEELLVNDTEIKAAFNSIEEVFEKIGMENASIPPKGVKDQLMANLQPIKKITSEKTQPSSSSSFRFYFGIAASFAVLLMASSIWLYSQLNALKNNLQIVEANNKELKIESDKLKNNFSQSNKLLAVLSHPDTKQYILEGNTLMPEGKAISYVNHGTKSVILNTERLPELDSNHDYQMWADVEGEMINMGVIDISQPLLAMNYINNSESLNITIEPTGGSEHPTVERLVTNIYL